MRKTRTEIMARSHSPDFGSGSDKKKKSKWRRGMSGRFCVAELTGVLFPRCHLSISLHRSSFRLPSGFRELDNLYVSFLALRRQEKTIVFPSGESTASCTRNNHEGPKANKGENKIQKQSDEKTQRLNLAIRRCPTSGKVGRQYSRQRASG